MNLPGKPYDNERELLKKAQKGDQQAREMLLMSMMPYAIKMAKKYNGKGMDFEDYRQWAMIGVLEAIDRFDLKLKTRLITFVTWRVRHRLTVAQLKGELIRIPKNNRNPHEPKIMVNIDGYDVPVKEQEPINYDSFKWLEILSARERKVLEYRFFNNMTLEQAGVMIHVSKERIRQIIKESLERIRNAKIKKPRKNHVLSASEEVSKCFENRGN